MIIFLTKKKLEQLFERWKKEDENNPGDDYYYHGALSFKDYLEERILRFGL